MAFANIDLTASVPAPALDVDGSGVGQFDVCPTGVVVFAKASVALAAADDVYVTPAGVASKTKAATSLAGKVQCAVAAGEGVWVLVFGVTSGANPAFVVPALGV